MLDKITNELLQYGILGLLSLVMGLMLYTTWKLERQEKSRLIAKLEECHQALIDVLSKLDDKN
jgi:hypothetical protein